MLDMQSAFEDELETRLAEKRFSVMLNSVRPGQGVLYVQKPRKFGVLQMIGFQWGATSVSFGFTPSLEIDGVIRTGVTVSYSDPSPLDGIIDAIVAKVITPVAS